jgi:hypothetical protein
VITIERAAIIVEHVEVRWGIPNPINLSLPVVR